MMKSERQLIDVEEARGYVETFMADPILKMAANAVLNNTPRVDAVEVVRCKECKHYAVTPSDCVPYCSHESGYVGEYIGNLFYCANGERKAEDVK